MTQYNPLDWYWTVNEVPGKVWASGRKAYVDPADADYLAWCQTVPQPIITRTIPLADLALIMQKTVVAAVLAGGLVVTSAASPALDGTYAIDPASQSTLTSLATGLVAGKPLPGGGATFNYPDMALQQHAFTGAQFLEFATAIENWLYAWNQGFAALLAGQAAALPAVPVTIS